MVVYWRALSISLWKRKRWASAVRWLRKLQGPIEDFVDDAHGFHLSPF